MTHLQFKPVLKPGINRIPLFALAFFALLLVNVHAIPAENSGEVAGVLCAQNTETNERYILPLKKTDVKLEVTAGIVKTVVTQTFVNETDVPLEAIYIFPLPSRAAVTQMTLKIGDRLIRSIVQEKEQAKKTYEQAKSEGKKTALIEQERPNLFTASVANFLPGETAEICFSYVDKAPYIKGFYSITFPMVAGQRYIPAITTPPGQSDAPDATPLNPPILPPTVDPQHRLRMTVRIYGLPVESISSNTHAIRVEPPAEKDSPFIVTLANEITIPDMEFNIKIHLKEESTPRISFIQSRNPDTTYGLLTVLPPINEKRKTPAPPRDVVFLIDTSGSMSGSSIGQAKTGLTKCLAMLRPQDRFTIVRFASEFSAFAPDFRDVNAERLEDAREYIKNLEADGGTEMQKALEYVLRFQAEPEHLKLIVFLTDGDVGNEDSLLLLLSEKLKRTRLFAFAIGSAPNEYLIRKMGELGRGESLFIRSQEDIGEIMTHFFKTLQAPVLTDIELDWKDSSGKSLSDVDYYPRPCGDVFKDRPLQVTAKLPANFHGSVSVRGKMGGASVEYEYLLDSANTQHMTHNALEKLYGRSVIQHLMVQYICGKDSDEQGDLQRMITEVALKYQLISRFTARVAVEEQTVVKKMPNGELKTVNVRVPLPKGWNPAQFTATATNDPALWITGASLFFLGFLTLRQLLNNRGKNANC